jgi:hypothetical protein
MARIRLLGPQRFRPTVRAAAAELDLVPPLAVITAGWQEREHEVDELDAHLDARTVNLRLYERFEDAVGRDRELFRELRRRQDRLRQIQELYRIRLAHLKDTVRELFAREGDPEVLEAQREGALEMLRVLDREHLGRIGEVHLEFERTWRPAERAAVARHRTELRKVLDRVSGLLVAGGHVAVLLSRLRLFGIGELAADKPIVAWSAGAMALTERVVLFHDFPPQGGGFAEVLDLGIGLCPSIVALPHASRRLALADRDRVVRLARRFAPAPCVTLDPGGTARWDGRSWTGSGVARLEHDGAVVPMAEA